MAPERLLVFEVRGPIRSFANAVRNIPGLELVDEEELVGDETDEQPAAYLLVPDLRALREIESLWRRWTRGQVLPKGFTPWRDVFGTLRDLRPWGPQDRVHATDRQSIAEEIAELTDQETIRLEVELVFRPSAERAAELEQSVGGEILQVGGSVISRCRISDIRYHAVLGEFPVAAARLIVERRPESIAGIDLVMHIRPQSEATSIEVSDMEPAAEGVRPQSAGSAIVALLDGVPVAGHPLLAPSIVVDDQFDLERQTTVADRVHGTAMASLIVHGDRNSAAATLPRPLHCVPILGSEDRIPSDRLVIDLIYQAVVRMRDGVSATAPDVLIVNLSLGNKRQPFHGRLSPWARLVDRLSYRFGILFLISAGNHVGGFDLPDFATMLQFEDADSNSRSSGIVRALGDLKAQRRLLSPAEAVNALTIGAANLDSVPVDMRRAANYLVDPFPELAISNPSSALGPGFANATKPDLLLPGSREHLSMVSSGTVLRVRPSSPSRAMGLRVAAPPRGGIENLDGYTNGTSAATALASRACHLVHDALEAAYGERFSALPHAQRAALLKALLVHTASWPQAAHDLLKEVLGPADGRQYVQQRDNIRRFLGYGIGEPDLAVACAADRATFWATGDLGRDQGVPVAVPIPTCANAHAQPHALLATLSWFTPTSPGRQAYRMVRMSLHEPDEIAALQVSGAKAQPDVNQCGRGTVYSRRWEGSRPPAISAEQTLNLFVQRDPDQGSAVDERVAFGLAVTFAMPGVVEIYDEVRARVSIAPRVTVR